MRGNTLQGSVDAHRSLGCFMPSFLFDLCQIQKSLANCTGPALAMPVDVTEGKESDDQTPTAHFEAFGLKLHTLKSGSLVCAL